MARLCGAGSEAARVTGPATGAWFSYAWVPCAGTAGDAIVGVAVGGAFVLGCGGWCEVPERRERGGHAGGGQAGPGRERRDGAERGALRNETFGDAL